MPAQAEIINLSDTTPAAPTGRLNVQWQKGATSGSDPATGYPIFPVSANIPASPYDIVCSYVGQPGAGALVLILTATRAVNFLANFAGSFATMGVNPTATAVYTARKNGTAIGTVSISTAGVATFATVSGAAQTLAAGDRLTVTGPSPADSALADVGITFAGTR